MPDEFKEVIRQPQRATFATQNRELVKVHEMPQDMEWCNKKLHG